MASQDRTNTTDDRTIATEQSADDRLNQLEQTALQVAQNESAGEPVPGLWEPVVLEEGIADPGFVAACGLDSGT